MPQNKHEENEHEENEHEVSSWLSNEFLEKVLRHCEQTQDIELKNFKLTPDANKSEHFGSTITRLKVDYRLKNEEKTKYMIMKTMPDHKLLKDSTIFEIEIGIYSEVIPKFEEILRSVGDNTKLGATCLYHSLSPRKLIILEDLVPLGYNVLRDRQSNLNEAKAVYSKIAKWHAISYKLNIENSLIFDEYKNGLFTQTNIANYGNFFTDGITNFIELLEEHEDLKQYKIYFEPLVGKILNDCIKSCTEARKNPQVDGLYALCHGDFHHNNLMFKHDLKSEQFLDVMILDFQNCHLGSLVADILYSKYVLLDYDTRCNHLDEVLYFYFSTFQETLKRIDFIGDIPKMRQFQQEMMRHKHLDVYLFVTFLPLFYAIFDLKVGSEEIRASIEARKKAFRYPKYVNEVRELLPKLLHKGYFEQ